MPVDLAKLSRGEPGSTETTYRLPQRDIDEETERLMLKIRESSGKTKLNKPLNKPACLSLETKKEGSEFPSNITRGTGEHAQSSANAGIRPLIDAHIYGALDSQDDDGGVDLEELLEAIQADMTGYEMKDLEEHLLQMQDQGKVSIEVRIKKLAA